MSTMDKISENLFAKIRGRFPSVTLGDATGIVTDDPKTARYFDFDFQNEGNTLGKVSITLTEEDGVVVTYNNEFISEENADVKENWYSFLKELRVFAKKNMLNFDTRDITKSNLDKRDYAHLTKTSSGDNAMSESKMYGTSRTSYEDVDNARLVLKHNQPVNLEIPGSRTQHVHSIYIENNDNGERYKYPYRHLNGARALARHVSEGGNLYDDFGKYIVGLSEELAKLRQFKTYMNRSAVMAEGLKGYLDVVNERLDTVKKECLKLQRPGHYLEARKNFTVTEITEVPEEVSNNWIDELTIRSFNEELKSVFPYVYKLVNDSKKVEEIGPDDDLIIEKTNEGFDPDEFDDEVDVEWTGDDGEVASGMLYYTATVDHEHGTVNVDPKSLRGEVDQEQNVAKVDQDLIDMQLKDDWKHFLEIAQDHANDTWDGRDNKYAQGEEMNFDPVASFDKAISYIVGEAENALTDGSDEDKAQAIEKLNGLMAEHFPAGVNGTNAIESLAGIIDDPKLQEMFRKIGQKDSDICVRPLVMKWIKAHAPDVAPQVNTGDMQGGEEVPTEARPLDHPEKGYFDPKILKKIVKQKGAERDKEKGDNKKPSEKLEELIKSYYDYTTNKFPKGETAVMTAVEKEFGEKSLPFAQKMIEKLFHGQDQEMERVKQLAGI